MPSALLEAAVIASSRYSWTCTQPNTAVDQQITFGYKWAGKSLDCIVVSMRTMNFRPSMLAVAAASGLSIIFANTTIDAASVLCLFALSALSRVFR